MAEYKGSSIVLLKQLLESKGPQAKKAFLNSLTPEQGLLFQTVIPAAWVPIDQAQLFIEKLAPILYPNDPDGFFKLGEVRAQDTVKGIYKMLFKVLSTEAIVDASYRLWPMLHSHGTASVSRSGKEATFSVTGYPQLPRCFRLMMSGFIHGCLTLGKAKNIKLKLIETDPANWRWSGTWE